MNRRALAGREKKLGSGHPDTLTSLHNLAIALWHRRNFDEAETISRRALAGSERVLGTGRADTLMSVRGTTLSSGAAEPREVPRVRGDERRALAEERDGA